MWIKILIKLGLHFQPIIFAWVIKKMKTLVSLFLIFFIGFSVALEEDCPKYIENFVAKHNSLQDKTSNAMFCIAELIKQNPSIPEASIRRFYINALKSTSTRVCSDAKTLFGAKYMTTVITLPTFAALGRVVENINIGANCGDRIVKFRGIFFFFLKKLRQEYPPVLPKEVVERTKTTAQNYFKESYVEANLNEIKEFVPRIYSTEGVNTVCASGRKLFSMDNTLSCRRTVMKIRTTYKLSDRKKKYNIVKTVRAFVRGKFPEVSYQLANNFLDVLFKCVQDALFVCKSFKSTFGREWNIPSDLIDHL